MEAYQIGMDRVELEGGRSFLMATPEKALADKLRDERGTGIRTQRAMRSYLLDHLRIDSEGLGNLDPNRLAAIASRYHSRKIAMLTGVVRHLARSSFEGTPCDLSVDSVPYKFQDLTGKPTDLFSQVQKDKRVGFFNEEDTVKLSNIVIDKIA